MLLQTLVFLCGASVAFGWFNNFGGLGYGGYGGYGGFGGYGSSNANALGGGSAEFGNVGTNNVAFTNSNPWSSSGFASNQGYGSGYGVNIFGAANSNSQSGYNGGYYPYSYYG